MYDLFALLGINSLLSLLCSEIKLWIFIILVFASDITTSIIFILWIFEVTSLDSIAKSKDIFLYKTEVFEFFHHNLFFREIKFALVDVIFTSLIFWLISLYFLILLLFTWVILLIIFSMFRFSSFFIYLRQWNSLIFEFLHSKL